MAFLEKRGKERQAIMNPTVFALTGDLQLLKEESQILSGRFNLASIFWWQTQCGALGWALGSSEGLGDDVGREAWGKRSRMFRSRMHAKIEIKTNCGGSQEKRWPILMRAVREGLQAVCVRRPGRGAVVLPVRLSCSRAHGMLLWSKCFLNIHRTVSLGSTLSENDSHPYLYN